MIKKYKEAIGILEMTNSTSMIVILRNLGLVNNLYIRKISNEKLIRIAVRT